MSQSKARRKPGRPRRYDPPPQGAVQIGRVLVTPEERAAIMGAAGARGRSASAFIKAAALFLARNPSLANDLQLFGEK